MRRAPLLTTLVLAVTLTAGCSGLLSGAGTDPDPDPATETATVMPAEMAGIVDVGETTVERPAWVDEVQ